MFYLNYTPSYQRKSQKDNLWGRTDSAEGSLEVVWVPILDQLQPDILFHLQFYPVRVHLHDD